MMHTAVRETSIDAFYLHAPKSAQQRVRIVEFVRSRGGDWSIGEIARALEMEKSTVSARVNELLNDSQELIERPKRRDRISGITIRPVALPALGQGALF